MIIQIQNILQESNNTTRIQEFHILFGHIICQLVEEKIFPNV